LKCSFVSKEPSRTPLNPRSPWGDDWLYD
jgi:hypothetical protein